MPRVKRIGLDARMIGEVPTGLGTYAAGLIGALAAIDRDHRYVVIRRRGAPPVAPGPDVEEAVLPGELDTPRNLLHGRAVSALGLDLYHSLHHFLPLGLTVPRVVVTLHDLIWIEHAGLIIDGRFRAVHQTATHLFARAAMPYALARADRIVSVSQHSASRAIARYRVDPQRIAVVHHGIDHLAFPFREPAAGGGRPFVVVGNSRPYKNVAAAIRALAICAGRHPDAHMVVAGRGDSAGALRQLAARLGVADRLRFVGPLPHDEILGLLHGAAALVFPSLIEGFGIPVLEAMAAGCPVIGSSIPTVAEVAGGAALLCDPRAPEDIAAAMRRVLDHERLRVELAQRGRARAAAFSWERCAAETLAVYRELL